MLLIDVSNLMYVGASARPYTYSKGEVVLHSIPYIMHRMAAACAVDPDVIAVFDSNNGRSSLARTDGYKAGRQRNPLVAWEIRVLKALFVKYRIPHVEVFGEEADTVINTICADFKGKDNVYIMSADADLYSNIYDDGNTCCETVTFSSKSYSVNKFNFESVTDYDYNFTDIHKILRGCKSDNIKPMEDGRKIYERYLKYVKAILKRSAGYDAKTMYLSELEDWQVLPFTEFKTFYEWFKGQPEYTEQYDKDLLERRELIQGNHLTIPPIGKRNWEGFNHLAVNLELESIATIRSVHIPSYVYQEHVEAIQLIKEVRETSATMFEATDVDSRKVEEVSNTHIFSLLNKEGDL